VKTVILAEPEPVVRRLLRSRLEAARVPVREALTLPAILAAAAGPGRVAALVAGEWLDGLDGAGLAAAVRAISSDLPIFFFVGDSLPPAVFEVSGVEVFLKPNGLVGLCHDLVALAADRAPADTR
jgi:DNA-binding NtrC family response regulator